MKQFLLSLLLCLVGGYSLSAQSYPGCDGSRYRSMVFSTVNSTTDLKFGEGTTIAGNFQELFLNVYEPADDTQDQRPVIILAFGGSFITGERQDLEPLCLAYASQGYVAVTIDYRLYDLPLIPFPTADEMREVVVQSLSDFKAAIRFMREDAATENQFRIDPDQIFVGGVSAGAIAAAHTAVLQETDEIDDFLLGLIEANGGFEGNSSTNTSYSSEVQGYINLSGALNDASWIDANDPPFVSVHDDMDVTVPYGTGFANVLGVDIVYLEGSGEMRARADSLNVVNELWTIEGSFGHVSYFNNADDFNATVSFTSSFVHDQICGEIVNVQDIAPALEAVQVFPNPTIDRIQVKNPEGLSLSLRLLDSTGKLVASTPAGTELWVSNLAAGNYWLEVTDMGSLQRKVLKVVLH